MLTLLGTLLGFFGSIFPDLLKMLRESHDRKHEIAILDRQLEQQKRGYAQRLEEISLKGNLQIEALQNQMLYKTYFTGIKWVDALNGTVRPVIAYAFFTLYALVKILSFIAMPDSNFIYGTLWTEEDSAVFAGIISFYFGQRAMSKVRG